VDPPIKRSHEELRMLAMALALLAATGLERVATHLLTKSVALLAGLIRHARDASTSITLAVGFLLGTERSEHDAGLLVDVVLVRYMAGQACSWCGRPKQIVIDL
jgi:hypothetical protein